ncbi:hypothetical protein K431DRAFT_284355 [Polychaeton citri CBS 116435]|uniref:Uncharacterized protein n=1 Tax=Polychaeton citri CBS 116435 TaxID=1314669 RepID=A0A9P4UQV1_9PEZI|nr:hypothetical protein K431DRAFT_284355 [Polychaeton citri CBS 116435]
MEKHNEQSLGLPLQPPSYTSSTSTRSILDLHTQIRANASILNPRNNDERSSDDHLEVITAEVPAAGNVPNQSRSSTSGLPSSSRNPSGSDIADGVGSTSPPKLTKEGGGGHYAVIVRRTNSKRSIKIILRSRVRATVEDALEDLLRLTERELHSRLEAYGRQTKDEECTVM